MTDTPQTVSGTTLAAFLHGLLPEDDGLAKQIAWAEEQAAAAERRATVERIRGPVQTYLTIGKRWVEGKVPDAEWREVQKSFQAALDEVVARG